MADNTQTFEIKINLRYSKKGWKLMQIKGILDDDFYLIPKTLRSQKNYPDYLTEQIRKAVRGHIDKCTFDFKLKGNQINFFRRNGKFVIHNTTLKPASVFELSEIESFRRLEARKKQLKNLQKFNPEIHDSGRFRDQFREVFQDQDETIAKLELFSYMKKEDHQFFRELMNNGSDLNEMLDYFYQKYQPLKERTKEELNNITLEQCSNDLDIYIHKLFLFYENYVKGLTFKAQLIHVIEKLPEHIKSLFTGLSENEEKALFKTLKNEKRVVLFIKEKLNSQTNQHDEEDPEDDFADLKRMLNRPNI